MPNRLASQANFSQSCSDSAEMYDKSGRGPGPNISMSSSSLHLASHFLKETPMSSKHAN